MHSDSPKGLLVCLLKGIWSIYIFVWDNLNILDMASGLEDLAQDVLGDSGIKPSNI